VKSKCLSRDPVLVLTNPMGFLKVAAFFSKDPKAKAFWVAAFNTMFGFRL